MATRPEEKTSTDAEQGVASHPTPFDLAWDRGFRWTTLAFSWLTILLVLYILVQIGGKAIPAIRQFGVGFLTSTTWNANKGEFGVLPEIWGTLYSSLLALFIGGSFGIAIAVFLTQDFMPRKFEVVFKNIVELLAAIPSVVYGLWGIYVVIPTIRPAANWLHEKIGFIPLFGSSLSGPGLLPAALVLAIMILPTISAVSRDAIGGVPMRIKEAAYGLGATRWEVILRVILPTSATGIFGALVLGFGRALGETMAIAMLVGNSNQISLSLLSPANTLAALLANNFPEAGPLEEQVLMYAALILMAITLVVNLIGTAIMNHASKRLVGAAR